MSTEQLDPAVVKRQALVVAIVGVVCGGALAGVLGIIAFALADTRPDRSRTLTSIAWLLLVIVWILLASLFIGAGGINIATPNNG